MTKIKVIVPKGMLFDPKSVIGLLETSLDAVSQGAKVDFEATVETWDKKPEFKIQKGFLSRSVFTIDEIYSYVNNGTVPHPIAPKIATGMLVFFSEGFRAKSRVGALRSNKGRKANKGLVHTKIVKHPGTEARLFDKAVQNKWYKQMPVILQRVIDSEFVRQAKNNP